MNLREALRAHLETAGESAFAFCRRLGLSDSQYTAVNRWVKSQRDPRTKRRFPLALYLRVRVAREIGFEGRLLTDAEVGHWIDPAARRAPPFSPVLSSLRREEQEEE